MAESIQLPLLGPGIDGRSKSVTAQKRQNLFMEVKQEKDKSNLVAYGTPGLKLFANFGNNPARGMWWWESKSTLFIVVYNKLYEVFSDGAFVVVGELNSTSGNVSMADNGLQLIIVDGQNAYIFQPNTGELTYNYPVQILRNYTFDSPNQIVTVTETQPYVTLCRYIGESIEFTSNTGNIPTGTYTIDSITGNTWTFTVSGLGGAAAIGTAYINNPGVILVNETLTTRKNLQQVNIKVDSGLLPSATYTINALPTSAPYLIVGNEYVIQSLGSDDPSSANYTDFTLVGASLNQAGIVFTATGTTTGAGTVTDANDWLIRYLDALPATNGNLRVINNFRNVKDSYTGVNFPGANTVVFIDSYFVINDPNTKQFWLSGQYDGFNWDPLQFASKEAYTDDLQAVFVDNGNLVLLGTISQEYWQNTGSFPFPFQRIAGSPTDIGLAARWSIARCAGEMFYLGRTRRGGVSVVRIQNYHPVVVSTPDLDYLLTQYQNIGDAIAFSYRQNGHEFYQISFQKEGKTWLYDATTDAWSVLISGRQTRHYANFGAQYLNQIAVTDYRNGNLYILDPQSFTDNGELIARELITPHLFANTSFNKLHIYRFRLDMQQGVGLVDNVASYCYIVTQDNDPISTENNLDLITENVGTEAQTLEPQIMMQVSRDGGFTYGREMWTSFGAIGQYLRRAEWRRLGVSRSFVFKLRITDPVKVVLIGAAAYATEASK